MLANSKGIPVIEVIIHAKANGIKPAFTGGLRILIEIIFRYAIVPVLAEGLTFGIATGFIVASVDKEIEFTLPQVQGQVARENIRRTGSNGSNTIQSIFLVFLQYHVNDAAHAGGIEFSRWIGDQLHS